MPGIKHVVGVAAYRLRVTWRARLPGYVAFVLLIALLGGVAMGAVAGARRTQSSFPGYLASTNPSDMQFFTGFAQITGDGYSPRVARAIARIPHVKHEVDTIGFDGNLQVLGNPIGRAIPGAAPPAVEGSLNGAYLAQDRVTVVRGRTARPTRDGEFVMSEGGAAQLGLHIGSTLPVAFFTNAQVSSPTYAGYPTDQPYLLIRLRLVGIVESSSQIVEDDDAALQNQFAVITPALTRRLVTCCAYYSYADVQLEGGLRHEAAVLDAAKRVLPNLGPAVGRQTYGPVIAKAERALRPTSIAFGTFGVIAFLAALLICGQVIGRLVRRDSEDAAVLRALGAGPSTTIGDACVGLFGAIVLGSALAGVVAVGLSPLAPIGAVRSVYPHRGISFDWAVLGLGFGCLVVALASAAVVMSYRGAPHRSARPEGDVERHSSLGAAAASSGLPPAAVTGIRSALGAQTGRDAAPVRSAVLGAILAVVVVVTSVTFGLSLRSLVSHPSLYGWNWDYALLSGFSGQEDLPAAQTTSLLAHDHAVARFAGIYLLTMRIDGQGVPALATTPNAAVGPRLLTGHGLHSSNEVVLGPATLAQLHKHVGDIVGANTGGPSPIHLRIVGTATLPTIKGSGEFLQMGTGAVVSSTLFPDVALNFQGSPIPGPNAVLISIRSGVKSSVALRSLDRITQTLNQPSNPDAPVGGVVSNLRPAEIANYGSVGSTPIVLAGVLTAGAVAALGIALVASVRRRRQEFALLKIFGFTRRQLAATVSWQASVCAAVGVILGVPLGVVLGRWLWTLFARGIWAVPDPTVSPLSILFVVLGALLFANLVAAIPGRVAARTPAAILLQGE